MSATGFFCVGRCLGLAAVGIVAPMIGAQNVPRASVAPVNASVNASGNTSGAASDAAGLAWKQATVRFSNPPNGDRYVLRHVLIVRVGVSRVFHAPVPIHAIAKLMGHATIQMSMRYARLSPDFNQSAVDKLMEFKIKGTPKRTPVKRKLLSD